MGAVKHLLISSEKDQFRGEIKKRDRIVSEREESSIQKISGEDEPSYSEDGVDLTLIRWMLSLSPEERLHVLQDAVESVMRLRDARRII